MSDQQQQQPKRMFRDETESYQRGHRVGYAKGYTARTKYKLWPDHRPPHPPHPLAAMLFERGQAMRDAIDGYLANLEEDDDLQDELGNPLDAWDEAMQEITRWLTSMPGADEQKTASTAAPGVRPPGDAKEG